MKQWIALLALLALACTSCAATLAIRFTAPTQNNDATCGLSPILSQGTDSVWCVVRVPSLNIADSVWTARGVTTLRSYPAAAGTYNVFGSVARVVGGQRIYSCIVGPVPIEAVAKPDVLTITP